jgi:hypothetical protein
MASSHSNRCVATVFWLQNDNNVVHSYIKLLRNMFLWLSIKDHDMKEAATIKSTSKIDLLRWPLGSSALSHRSVYMSCLRCLFVIDRIFTDGMSFGLLSTPSRPDRAIFLGLRWLHSEDDHRYQSISLLIQAPPIMGVCRRKASVSARV